MIDIRQSLPFSQFMASLGWEVLRIENTYVYLRKFPIVGYFAKIPRIDPNVSISKILSFIRKYKIFRLKISPNLITANPDYELFKNKLLTLGFHIDHDPFNPTTTYQIDLSNQPEPIFSSFSQAKRRAVRRAQKNGIVIEDSQDLQSFIQIRRKQYGLFGFLVTHEMRPLWKAFGDKNATLLLAYQKNKPSDNHGYDLNNPNNVLAGVLLLYWKNIAYYWYASSLKDGKKLFAPTLLVWESIKTAYKHGCTILDFEGVCDMRFPQASKPWKGFTKFKEGFNGKEVIFAENFYLPIR